MAKATLTFEDNPDGTVGIVVAFAPSVSSNEKPTPAQGVALVAMTAAMASGEEGEKSDD